MKSIVTAGVCGLLLAVAALVTPTVTAATGACAQPATNYGSVTQTVTMPSSGNYYIWSRLSTDAAANKSYLLQIDNSYCFTVGSSNAKTLPIYTGNTFFNADASNWINTDTNGSRVLVGNLPAGTHTIKMIGNAPNVVLDRLIFTQDGNCTPSGKGDNCAIPPDTTPPSVSVSRPVDGATITTATSVTANVSDNVAVTRVEFYVDGVLKATDTSADFSYSLVPSTLSLGTHQITARAFDAAGNNATSAVVRVNVADSAAPKVAISAPTSGSTQSGTIIATASATDNVAVSKVSFFIDDNTTPVATETIPSGTNYSSSINTASVANGTHSLTAKAYDAAGNVASTTMSFVVNNQTSATDTVAPSLAIPTLSNGVFLNVNSVNKPYASKNYAVSVTAADNSGIKQVVFKVNGVVKSTVTVAPYRFVLDLSALGCGAHTVTAVATDKSARANVTTSNVNISTTYAEDIVSDANCKVNYLDLSALAGKYGQSGTNLGRTDINGDGVVNYLDLSALASKYSN